MLTYLERYQLLQNSSFKNRVQLSLWIVCTEVLDENANTPNHAARVEKATVLLKGEADLDTMRLLTLRLISNATIGDQGMMVEDTALKNIVSTLFNTLL